MADTSREHTRWFDEALAHHQRGDLVQAENIYQRLLANNADHTDAGSLLGTIRIQQGRFQDGIALLEKVLRQSPHHPVAEANLGLAYHEVGDLPQAIAHYRRAIALDNKSDQSVNNLACALRENGQLDEAQALLNEIVQRDATFAPAHYNLGLIHKTRGELTAAMACYRQAIRMRPRYADAYFNLGNALGESGDAVAALAAYDAAIAITPEMAQAWDNRGLILLKLDRSDEALASHQRATKLAPNSHEAQCNLGSLYSHLGRKEESLTCYRRALELKPDYAEVWCNMANTLTQQGKPEEAIVCCDRALAIKPELFVAHLNRGAALLEWGRDDEAAIELAWCAARDSTHPDLLTNLGTMAASNGESARALDYYRMAVQVGPTDAMTQWNYGLACLATGDLEHGWIGYDWGLKTTQRVSAACYELPRWQGEPIHDKTLLVTAEQGIGDEIQLASCLPNVMARARRVILQCDPRLVALYQRSFPHLIVHGGPRNEPTNWLKIVGGADVVIELGSLPRHVRPRLQDFLNNSAYVQPDPIRVAYWRERLAQLGPQPKVGIAWRSRLTKNRRLRHYPRVEDVLPLLRTAGVTFINLQYDDCEPELDQLRAQSGADIQQLDGIDLFNNLDDSSALMRALDLVIAPSTTTFVLAGATGTPCWQMCPCPMEAWLFGRDDHVWFSQARLYRQKRAFEWGEVIRSMAQDLELWVVQSRLNKSPENVTRSQAIACHQQGKYFEPLASDDALLDQHNHDDASKPESMRAMDNVLGSDTSALTIHAGNMNQRVDDLRLTALDLLHIEQGIPSADVMAGAAQTVLRLRPWIVIDGITALRDDELAGVLHALGYRVMSPAALGVQDKALPRCLVCCPIPLWSRDNPSPRYRQLLAFYQQMHTQGYDRVVNGTTIHTRPEEAFPGNELPLFAQPIEQLIRMHSARTLLDYGAGKGKQYEWPLTVEGRAYPSVRAYWHGVDIRCYEPALGAAPLAEDARFDGVVCTDVLEHIAESDMPWVLNELFSRARHFVFASIACFEALARLPDGSNAHCTVHDPAWWRGILSVLAVRYPQVRFVIAFGLPPGSDVPDDTVWYDSLGQTSQPSRPK